MFPSWSALRPAVVPIVSARNAECNGLMVYAFGYLKSFKRLRNEENLCSNVSPMPLDRVRIRRARLRARDLKQEMILSEAVNGRLEVYAQGGPS